MQSPVLGLKGVLAQRQRWEKRPGLRVPVGGAVGLGGALGWEFSQWMSAWCAQQTVGQLGPSQVPAVVGLLFFGSESCVIGWVLLLGLQGSTWSCE